MYHSASLCNSADMTLLAADRDRTRGPEDVERTVLERRTMPGMSVRRRIIGEVGVTERPRTAINAAVNLGVVVVVDLVEQRGRLVPMPIVRIVVRDALHQLPGLVIESDERLIAAEEFVTALDEAEIAGVLRIAFDTGPGRPAVGRRGESVAGEEEPPVEIHHVPEVGAHVVIDDDRRVRMPFAGRITAEEESAVCVRLATVRRGNVEIAVFENAQRLGRIGSEFAFVGQRL